MSNKEMKDELQEDTSGVSDENTGIEEEINATMDKIIVPPETDEDEMDDLGDYDDSAEEEPDPQPVRHHRKSARPGPVVYVPVDDMETARLIFRSECPGRFSLPSMAARTSCKS